MSEKTCGCDIPCVADLTASAQCVRRVGSGTITVTNARVRTPPTAQVCVCVCVCVCGVCVRVCRYILPPSQFLCPPKAGLSSNNYYESTQARSPYFRTCQCQCSGFENEWIFSSDGRSFNTANTQVWIVNSNLKK